MIIAIRKEAFLCAAVGIIIAVFIIAVATSSQREGERSINYDSIGVGDYRIGDTLHKPQEINEHADYKYRVTLQDNVKNLVRVWVTAEGVIYKIVITRFGMADYKTLTEAYVNKYKLSCKEDKSGRKLYESGDIVLEHNDWSEYIVIYSKSLASKAHREFSVKYNPDI
jgi:hypothetical protein